MQPLRIVHSEAPRESETATPSSRVALVNMPFTVTNRPSIQCSILKAVLTSRGHQADIYYFNLEFAAALGADFYNKIAVLRSDQFVGDWLFSIVAFGDRADDQAYMDACPGIAATCRHLGCSFQELCHLRRERIPAIVDQWVKATDWSAYAAIGFTSTFEQNVAALGMARRIKEAYPSAVTIFGGANFDGEMGPEYVRACPWIDYAVIGEGDESLPALIGQIAQGISGVNLPGVVSRVNGVVALGKPASPIRNMDGLPDPDYDDYFAALARLGRERLLGKASPVLLIETARGCWWGQKYHCTFCGLNAESMAFRSKSADRVLAELGRLADRYSILNFEAVDNIMDMKYLEKLCGPLGDAHYDYWIFYEVKGNLTRSQLKTMARAGIKTIQPGIESLSTHMLKLMRKGATMLMNVRLLKWAQYYGIRVGWNVLMGFPGETIADYETQQRLLPLLFHLPPPAGCSPIWLERFSPYYSDPSFPVHDVEPRRAYRSIYPEDRIDLRKIAYFFDYEADDVVPPKIRTALAEVVAEWKARWSKSSRPALVYQRAPSWLKITDSRTGVRQVCTLNGYEAAVYEFCGETDCPSSKVSAWLKAEHKVELDIVEVEKMLLRFRDMGLMIEEEGRFLSLGLPADATW